MLGGLLAGSLLGSLLFGGGFNGGGFLDIILIGGLLFLAFKFFSRRRAATQGGWTAQCGRFRLAPQHARLRFDASAYGGPPKRQGRF